MRNRKEPWDFDRQRRFEREEILPPRRPELHVVHRWDSRGLQRLIMVAALIAVAVILVRSPSALLMLAALVSPTYLAGIAAFAVLLAVAAYKSHRAGRPF